MTTEQQILQFLQQPLVATVFFTWIVSWKALALWRSAGKKQLIWFLILLLVNTMGLLEIVYIFYLNRWDIDKGRLLNFLEKKFKKRK